MKFEETIQEVCRASFVPVPDLDKFHTRPGPWVARESEYDNLVRLRVYGDLERQVPTSDWHWLQVLRQELFTAPMRRPDIMTGAGFGWASSETLNYYAALEARYPHRPSRLLLEASRERFFFTLGYGAVTSCDNPVKYGLHDPKGPAVVFPDGQSFYVLQGVKVPNLQKPKAWADIQHLDNSQVAVLGDLHGWTDMWPLIHDQWKTLIDRDRDPTIGTLWALRHFNPMPRILEVRCDTGRTIFLRVPVDMNTALEAQERLWGVGRGEYRPDLQR